MYKGRSSWKVPYFSPMFFNIPSSGTQFIRNSNIPITFLKKNFRIHTGKVYHNVTFTEEMLGHKIGSFVPTKKMGRIIHTKNNKKLKLKSNKKVNRKHRSTFPQIHPILDIMAIGSDFKKKRPPRKKSRRRK